MTGIYLLSLIAGAGIVVAGLLRDLLGDAAARDPGSPRDPAAGRPITVRAATYFLLGFGGLGALFSWTWSGDRPVLAALVALAAGAAGAALETMVLRHLRESESSARAAEGSFVGMEAVVTAPLSADGFGRIQVLQGDRILELPARPFHAEAAAPERWRAVIVLEVQGGTALVSPVAGPAGAGPA